MRRLFSLTLTIFPLIANFVLKRGRGYSTTTTTTLTREDLNWLKTPNHEHASYFDLILLAACGNTPGSFQYYHIFDNNYRTFDLRSIDNLLHENPQSTSADCKPGCLLIQELEDVPEMARLSTNLYPKLTDLAIANLRSKKIFTVFDLMPEDSEKLMRYSGLTYQEILDLKEVIAKLYIGEIKTGTDLLKASFNSIIPTEIKSLDNLLKGGLRSGQIYEICGLSSSGKSQLCHTVAAEVALRYEKSVHYIDTKGDFCAMRIQTILEGKKCDENLQGLALHRVVVTFVATVQELLNFLHSIKSARMKLVIIDTLPAVFFNTDLDSHASSFHSSLNHFSNVIRYIANECNVALITVNLITQWRETAGYETSPSKNPMTVKPGLGKYWLSIPGTRLLMETGNLESRKITVWKSSYLASGLTCNVKITNAGVV